MNSCLAATRKASQVFELLFKSPVCAVQVNLGFVLFACALGGYCGDGSPLFAFLAFVYDGVQVTMRQMLLDHHSLGPPPHQVLQHRVRRAFPSQSLACSPTGELGTSQLLRCVARFRRSAENHAKSLSYAIIEHTAIHSQPLGQMQQQQSAAKCRELRQTPTPLADLFATAAEINRPS